MKNEQQIWTIVLSICAVVIGVALFKQFDFETFRFKKAGLGIVYLVTFIALIIYLVRGRKSRG